MYTDKLISSRKYFKMAAKSGFPFFVDHPVVNLARLAPATQTTTKVWVPTHSLKNSALNGAFSFYVYTYCWRLVPGVHSPCLEVHLMT